MTINIAINGLGRIGRCILRAITENDRNDVKVVAVNGPAATDTHVHLLKYDSIHGPFLHVQKTGDNEIDMGKGPFPVLHERDPGKISWRDYNVDVVLECTGAFRDAEEASVHIKQGARKVIISAPAEDVGATIVYGVNNHALTPQQKVISIGSCTTNCLAPVAKVLHNTIGIESGFMTTIHSYTNDQNIIDSSHKDLRRARAAAMSMIPTSTGAAKALGLVLPELKGKLDGTAIRVPTPNVSLVDLCFYASRNTTKEEINQYMIQAAKGALKGILATSDEPLVSIDFNHDPHSSIFDLTQTSVINGKFCRVAAWYDNEWGFSNRMIDVAVLFASGEKTHDKMINDRTRHAAPNLT